MTRTPLRRRVFALLAVAVSTIALAAPTAAAAAQWKPGTPPLSTPWTHLVGPNNALPEYPRPQLTRDRWQNLNGVWEFAGAAQGEAPPIGRALPERVLVPYPIESALSGIQRREDRMWYRRTFSVPNDWRAGRDARVRLNFGAVDYDSTIWVNGRQVGTHRGGYDSFSLDVTDALTGRGPQELVVGVTDLTDATWQPVGKQRNVPDRGIFYTSSSGIWQTVWLEPVAQANITQLDQTTKLADSTLRLTARVSGDTTGMAVEAVAYDRHRVVGRAIGAPNSELTVPVPNAKLWSPDSPFLYDLKVRLVRGHKTVDKVGSYFGMREVGTALGADGKLRMTLNGKILFHMSTLDQGFWPDGIHTAPTDAALRFDLEQHKVLGFNTVRKHIKVEPDRWFYHADKLGLLVWQDMPAMKTTSDGSLPPAEAQQEFERQMHAMVDKHKSFTSVVVWVPFNEGWGEWDRTATGRMADDVKAQDPSRLVNAHSGVNCCASKGDSGRGDILDHHEYVGPAKPAPSATRVAADGEHGGFGLEVDGHMWFGEGHAYEMAPDSATLTRRYVENQRDVMAAAQRCGISAAVYTQITDVEHEVNGFLTYDRQVRKLDFNQVRAVNEAIIRTADGSGSSNPPGPGTPGADGIAYYPFSEGTGTVTADEVGDHDATLGGDAAWTDGHPGAAVRFTGDSSTVDTGVSVLDTAGNYSVAAWVKLDSLGGFATAVSQDGTNHSAFFLQYSGADNRFAFSFAGVRALAPSVPETGRWYHLVGVRDVRAGSLTLYVDGQQAGTAYSCDGGPGAGNTVIGRAKFNGNPVDYWRGAIDQVHLFDRALPASEVAGLYNSGR